MFTELPHFGEKKKKVKGEGMNAFYGVLMSKCRI